MYTKKVYTQKDLFEKSKRQQSSMAAASAIHKKFNLSQTHEIKKLEMQVQNSSGRGQFVTNILGTQSNYQGQSSSVTSDKGEGTELTEHLYQQIHDIGYQAAAEVYERRLTEVNRKVTNSQNEAKRVEELYKTTFSQLEQIRQQFQNSLNNKAKEIIIKSCEKVLQTHLESPEFVEQYLATFIEQFEDESDVILRLSADMYQRVEGRMAELEAINPSINLHLMPDPQMMFFGCVLETPNQRIDLQLDSQLKKLKSVIEGL